MRPGSRLRTLCVLSGIAALNVSIATSALGQGVPAAKRPPGKPAAPAAPAAPAIKPLVETLTGEARTEYQAGKVLFDDGDYATALQKFKNAQSKQPDPRLLYNMASAEKSLRHYATSAKLLRRYLAEGGSLISAEDRQAAEDLVKVIEALTIPVTIKVSEEGAKVYLDDELLGVSPLVGATTLDIGQRKLRAEKPGFRALVMPVQIGPANAFDLVMEPLRGRLELKTKAGATVFLDDKPIGTGPLVVSDNLPVGGHALRITAPKMRPYQGEVVLEDGKARTIDIELEPDLEQLSEIRVAVGCADPRIRTPEEGLTVYFDDSQVSASPLGVRKRVEDEKEVPAYVPFTVPTGGHRVRLRFPGCDPLETTANAAAASAIDVTGMLPPERPWFNGTPAGSPNGFRVTAGVTFSTMTFGRFQNFFDGVKTTKNTKADVGLAGISGSVGTQTRWFMGVIDARYVVGSTTGAIGVIDSSTAPQPTITSSPQEADFTLWDAGLRIGPRVPINIASISGGGLAGAGVLHVTPTSPSDAQTGAFVRGGFWGAVEAQPLCDFSLGLQYSFSAITTGGPKVEAQTESAWAIHIGYQPNVLCRRKRGGLYRVDAGGAPSAQIAPSEGATPAAPAPAAPAPATPPPAALPPPPPPPSAPSPAGGT